jgi:hypothetical protein
VNLKMKLMFALAVGLAALFVHPTFAVAGILLTTSSARLANGTTLQIALGSPTSYVTINNVTDITFMDGSAAEVDVTNLTSDWKERLLGLPDGGVVPFNVHTDFGDAGQAAAITAKNNRTRCRFRITLPGGTTPTIEFEGYVRKFNGNVAVDSPIRTNSEILVSGPVTLA